MSFTALLTSQDASSLVDEASSHIARGTGVTMRNGHLCKYMLAKKEAAEYGTAEYGTPSIYSCTDLIL